MPHRRTRDPIFERELRYIERAHDTVILEQKGETFLAQTVELRELARRLRKSFNARDERRLRGLLRSLAAEPLCDIAHSFTLFFWLSNICEQRHAARIHRPGEPGTLRALFRKLERRGVAPEAIERAVNELRATIVLTAHPTDAMRWSVNEALERIERGFERRLHADDMERAECDAEILADITALWQTSALRHRKPTPLAEMLALRTPYLDTLSYLQVEILGRKRAALDGSAPPSECESLDAATHLTINGISAGLRNTG